MALRPLLDERTTRNVKEDETKKPAFQSRAGQLARSAQGGARHKVGRYLIYEKRRIGRIGTTMSQTGSGPGDALSREEGSQGAEKPREKEGGAWETVGGTYLGGKSRRREGLYSCTDWLKEEKQWRKVVFRGGLIMQKR